VKLTFEFLVEFVTRVNQDEFGNSDPYLPSLTDTTRRNQPRVKPQERDTLLHGFIEECNGKPDGIPPEFSWPSRERGWLWDLHFYVDLVRLRKNIEKGTAFGKGILLIPDSPRMLRGNPSQEDLDSRAKEALKSIVHPVAKFPSPPGLRWEDVIIAFISDNEIKVEAKELAELYSYDEIGFDDKRDGGKGKLWFVFRALAMLKGSATVDNLANPSKDKDNVSKDISRLKKILYNLMGIKDNPFYSYQKHQCYQTRFQLRDEQYVGVLRRD